MDPDSDGCRERMDFLEKLREGRLSMTGDTKSVPDRGKQPLPHRLDKIFFQ